MRALAPREIARIICGLVFALGAMYWMHQIGPMFDPVWTSGAGDPVPRNFSYMFFPRESAGIMDASGERIGPFRRALMMDDAHYRADGPVDVGRGDSVRRVAKSDLALTPPPGTLEMYWNDWQAHEAGAAGDCQSCGFSTRAGDHGKVLATLSICHAAHCYTFVYEIDGDAVTPLRMYRSGGQPILLGKWTLLGLLGLFVVYRMIGAALDRMLPSEAAAPAKDDPDEALAATSAL